MSKEMTQEQRRDSLLQQDSHTAGSALKSISRISKKSLASVICIQADSISFLMLRPGEAFCPEEIEDRSICIDGDIVEVLEQ